MQSISALADGQFDPSSDSYSQAALTVADFNNISQIVYKFSGIRFTSGKEELVRSRLMKRLRALNIKSFSAYIHYVQDDHSGQELRTMIDCLTTNKTSFFRENQHFEYMRVHILPEIKKRGRGIRLWSAGCSSGEEPYSIAMLLCEEMANYPIFDIKILATDISERVLAKARAAEYEKQTINDIPHSYFMKYLSAASNAPKTYVVNERIRKMVSFARLNLMDLWPMKGPFDVIFCRNVMIYFDNPTQQKLVRRFYDLLLPGGHLLVGHSESLVANSIGFRYIQPATYRKPG